jgi:WD40 repeat protein
MNRRRFLLTAAAVPLLLRDDPDALAQRLGGGPLALVTADTEARVVAVGLLDGKVRARIATLPGPRSIETVGLDALVAHTTEGAVSIIDSIRLRVRRVVHGFEQPRYTAASPDGRYAYVTDSVRGEVVVVDVAHGRIVSRTGLDGPARHVTISPFGSSLGVALGSSAERIAVLDLSKPRSPRVVRTIRPPFLAHDVSWEPGGRRVWVSSGDHAEEFVLVYDAASGHVLRRLPAGTPPQHVTFLKGSAHVSSGDDGTLRLFSLNSGKLVRSTTIPRGSYNVQRAWGVVLTPSLTAGTLCVVDRHGRVDLIKRVATSSHDACLGYAV